jgi:hypothetical protein
MGDIKKYSSDLEKENSNFAKINETIPGETESKDLEEEGQVDKKIEQSPLEQEENVEEKIDKLKEGVSGSEKANAGAITGSQTSISKEREKEIEKVLEEDLADAYMSMSPEKQKEFKVKGEETVKKINLILEKTKFKAKQIVDLIKSWLSMIPGVNKFFLEQEAKIKTDKILEIKNKE